MARTLDALQTFTHGARWPDHRGYTGGLAPSPSGTCNLMDTSTGSRPAAPSASTTLAPVMEPPPPPLSGAGVKLAPRTRRSWSRAAGLLNSSAFASLMSRGAGMAGAFAMSVAILRSLPTSEAGLVLLVYTLLTIAATLARFGADNLALREVSKQPQAAAPVIRNAFIVACALTPPVAVALFVAVTMQSRGDNAPQIALAAAAGVLPAALAVIAGAVLRGLGRVAAGTFAELGSPVLIAAAGISVLGLSGRASAASAVSMISVGYLLTALWSWATIWRLVPSVGDRGSEPVAFFRGFFASLAAFFTSTMGFYLFSWMPVLALGYFIADDTAAHSSVAYFNAAARISQFVILVPTIQISYLSQQFARLHHEGDLNAVNRISQSATRAAMAWGAVLAVVMVWAPHIPLAVFGGYSEAAPTLRILAVGALLVAAVGPVNGLMLTCGREREAGRYTLILLVVSAAVLPVLTRWGAEGVALGSSAISLVYAIASCLTLRQGGIHAALLPRIAKRAAVGAS